MAAQVIRTSVVLDRKTHIKAKRAARQLRISLSRFIESLVVVEVRNPQPMLHRPTVYKGDNDGIPG
jgi:hypothetical protein